MVHSTLSCCGPHGKRPCMVGHSTHSKKTMAPSKQTCRQRALGLWVDQSAVLSLIPHMDLTLDLDAQRTSSISPEGEDSSILCCWWGLEAKGGETQSRTSSWSGFSFLFEVSLQHRLIPTVLKAYWSSSPRSRLSMQLVLFVSKRGLSFFRAGRNFFVTFTSLSHT